MTQTTARGLTRSKRGAGIGGAWLRRRRSVRIIGGQMASLLLTAFPVPGIDVRRTRDADAAITTELAGSGVIHQRHQGTRVRLAPARRDVEDIYRLLEIADAYPPDAIGGWRLHETPMRGSRCDAGVHLHDLARHSRRRSNLEVPAARLATLIASLVTRPG